VVDVIDKPSPNHDARPGDGEIDILVLHYTGMKSAGEALARLCDPDAKVSAHYLIDEDGAIFRLVAENRRAWHAGAASWCGNTDVNGHSIGIELVNPGHEFGYQPFPDAQMAQVIALSAEIVLAHNIPAENVVGHSDVAPSRKQDPGELFDWARLAAAGVGLWPQADFKAGSGAATIIGPGDTGAEVAALQSVLGSFGYDLVADGVYGEQMELVVTAFQRHFRQSLVDGIADGETLDLISHMADLATGVRLAR